jgi:hypothetical protein
MSGVATAWFLHISGVACPSYLGKIMGQIVYMYMQLDMNSILKDFVKKVDK